MTDLKRHLPDIVALLSARLTELGAQAGARLDAHQFEQLRVELRAQLPASYGVASGIVLGDMGEQSLPAPLLLIDRTLPGAPQLDGLDQCHVAFVLAAFALALAADEPALAAALRTIESVKRLRQPEPVTARSLRGGRLPKQRFPLGCLLLAGPPAQPAYAGGEEFYLILRRNLSACAPANQPDLLWELGQALHYRQPLLDSPLPAQHQSGVERLPQLKRARSGYSCKARFQRRHFFYEWLCLAWRGRR